MGTSHAHWQTINNNNNNEKSNKKNTSCALWETDLPHHQRQTSIHTRQLRSAQTFAFLFFYIFHTKRHVVVPGPTCDANDRLQSTCTVKNYFSLFFFFFALLTRKRPRRLNPCLASSFSPLLLLFSKSRRTLDFVLRDVRRLAKGCCVFTLEGVGEAGGGRGNEGEGPPRCPVLFERKTQIQSKRLFFLSFFLSSTFSVFDIEFF